MTTRDMIAAGSYAVGVAAALAAGFLTSLVVGLIVVAAIGVLTSILLGWEGHS